MSTQISSFHEIAAEALRRGFSIIPLGQASKDPIGLGATSRTNDPATVAAWAEQYPAGNIGVCSDENVTILESDDDARFRAVVAEVSKALFGVSRELPATLTSQARENRPHRFYRTTPATLKRQESPAVSGMFEWRNHNQYVVGPGSLHPSGARYSIIEDVPIAEMPDWLIAVLDEMRAAYRGTRNTASSFVKVGPAALAIDAFKTKYGRDLDAMLADASFVLDVDGGERHYFLASMAGMLWNGDLEEDQFFGMIRRLADQYCVAGFEKSDAELMRIVEWTMKHSPCVMESPGFWKGLIWYESKEAYEKQAVETKDPEFDLITSDWFFDAYDFLREKLPPRRTLASDNNGTSLLYEKSLNQFFAYRGIGKTMFSHSFAELLINGGEFLRYKSDGGYKVLIADGELPDIQLQERLLKLVSPPKGSLWLMSPERMPKHVFPSLSNPEYQAEFLKKAEELGPDVIIFDTLTACFRFDTNDADVWLQVNQFFITLRLKGYCVIIVHHAGKSGSQRGRTDGDDNLDLSIKLEGAKGSAPGGGIDIMVSYEKVRAGGQLPDFRATFSDETGKWEVGVDEDANDIVAMLLEGNSTRSIAKQLGVSESKVWREKKKAETQGGIKFPKVKAGKKRRQTVSDDDED